MTRNIFRTHHNDSELHPWFISLHKGFNIFIYKNKVSNMIFFFENLGI